MDISGEHQLDVDHNIFKKRLGPDGLALPAGPVRHDGTLVSVVHRFNSLSTRS